MVLTARTFPAIWNGTADDLEAGDYSKVPTGGSAGEVLVKQSATDYDSAWDYSVLNSSVIQQSTATTVVSLPNVLTVGIANRAFTASRIFVWPFVVDRPIVVTSYRVRTNSGTTADTMRCGVYNWNTDATLGTLVQEFPTLTTTATNALFIQNLAAPLTLARGTYAIAWNVPTAAWVFRTHQTAMPGLSIDHASIVRFDAGAENVANPLPSTGPAVTIATDAGGVHWGSPVLLEWTYA
jgi:hypothetical protein